MRGTVLRWLKSYLSDRQQRVSIKEATSTPRSLECGVPQGSVLGPILFNVYSSALGGIIATHLSGSGYHFYADDCQIHLSCQPSELNQALKVLEECILDIKKWLCGHQLKLNDQKTEFMLIAPKQVIQRLDLNSATITIGSHNIEPKQAARNLGVIFDANMNMTDHVKAVCKSAYQQLYSISKVRKCLDAKSLEIIIHSFITTKLDYCNSILYNCDQQLLSRLQRVQNAAARLLTSTKKHEHIMPILKSLHWLPVSQRIRFKVLSLTHRVLNDPSSPVYLKDLLSWHEPNQDLRSGNRRLLAIPSQPNSLTCENRAFSIAGPTLWNDLPESLRCEGDYPVFKAKLKTVLFKNAYGF